MPGRVLLRWTTQNGGLAGRGLLRPKHLKRRQRRPYTTTISWRSNAKVAFQLSWTGTFYWGIFKKCIFFFWLMLWWQPLANHSEVKRSGISCLVLLWIPYWLQMVGVCCFLRQNQKTVLFLTNEMIRFDLPINDKGRFCVCVTCDWPGQGLVTAGIDSRSALE